MVLAIQSYCHYTRKGLNKLECLFRVSLSSLMEFNTLTRWFHLQGAKKMKCCECGPWSREKMDPATLATEGLDETTDAEQSWRSRRLAAREAFKTACQLSLEEAIKTQGGSDCQGECLSVCPSCHPIACLTAHFSISLQFYLLVRLAVDTNVYLSFYLPSCIFNCLSNHLSVCMSRHPMACLTVHFSIYLHFIIYMQ
jgi:hypothetical protein